ncbi:IS110 family transposase [Desulfurispora thermophila]|uniref:IS110 family transposase n=1 Tax=Desulfurispora thermophila TaxID=265470 RepID=UPI000371ED77|nr:IS110 family transposase [Desulfurispora thermophila]
MLKEIPHASYLLTIPGMSTVQVATIISEVGNLDNYNSARQLIKLAGLNLVENSSGNHKGQTQISKRGRAKLRCTLFRVALVLRIIFALGRKKITYDSGMVIPLSHPAMLNNNKPTAGKQAAA